MTQTFKYVWLVFLLTLPAAGPSLADEEPEENARNCVNASLIRNTKIVNDSSILFYMRSNSIYHNILRRQCKGLSREGRFSYHVYTGSLCNRDSIRILYDGAAGLQEGRSCQLGYFHEVTEEDIEMILDTEPRLPPPEPLPSADPEEIIKESDESR